MDVVIPLKQVQGSYNNLIYGCRLYRKTLHEKEKEKIPWSWERQENNLANKGYKIYKLIWYVYSCLISEKVASQSSSKKIKKLWDGITPDMTEEESEEKKGFVHHCWSWSSDVFNRFMEKLDSSRKRKTGQTTRVRRAGRRNATVCVKKWMTGRSMENSIEYNEFSNTTNDSQQDLWTTRPTGSCILIL